MKTESEIQKDVIEELKWDSVIKETEVGVIVKNDIVTLTGTVDSFSKKVAAEKAAMRVGGVKAVANDISVKLASTFERTDTDIAQAILNALKWRSSVPQDKIKVKVADGWVTLEGDVEWAYQKTSATNIVEELVGVRGVTNLIKIVSQSTTPKAVKDKITSAFFRNASLDASKIDVTVSGSTATLKGEVRSMAEKVDAENAAWAAPGINFVENKLVVDYHSVYA
jgi:osmotically-inducible protein OsmY